MGWMYCLGLICLEMLRLYMIMNVFVNVRFWCLDEIGGIWGEGEGKEDEEGREKGWKRRESVWGKGMIGIGVKRLNDRWIFIFIILIFVVDIEFIVVEYSIFIV